MNTLTSRYIRFNQVFLWVFCKILVQIVLDVNVSRPMISGSANSKIFISNHITHLDPFILIGVLTWQELHRVSPIRPMLAKGYFYSPLFFLAYPIGCYPTRPLFGFMKRFAGTSAAIRYARSGFTLGIYPEGRRVKSGYEQPKYGVIKILESSTDFDIYLIRMKQSSGHKRSFSITIQQRNEVVAFRNPQDIMDIIFAL